MSLNNGWPETPLPPPTNAGPHDDRDPTVPAIAAVADPTFPPRVHWSGKAAHGLWHIDSSDPPTSPGSSDVSDPTPSDSDPNAALFSGFINGDDGLTSTFAGNGGGDAASGNASVSFNVSVSGGGLVFHNTVTTGFSQALENCIIAAEQTLASNWTNSITLNISFSASNQGNNGNLASNSFYIQDVSYSALRAALVAHDGSSGFGQAAAASLPLTDPNPAGGTDWMLPEAYARMLGLSSTTASVDDYVSLNTSYNWNYGQDVTNTLTHEISEGAMGRVGGLGDQNAAWSTMDLFRFNASGTRDYTDGRDGQAAYFSYNGGQWLSSSTGLSFNNEYTLGRNGAVQANSGDTADWNQLDVFGTGSPGETNTLSQTDLMVLDVLGWVPAGSSSAVPAGTTADMLTENTAGNTQIYDIGNNQILQSGALTQLTSNYQPAGLGSFNGSDTSDLMLRDTTNGNLEVYDISNNAVTGTAALGAVGLDRQVSGFGQFSSTPGETDMIMRSTSMGAFEYYDIRNNAVTGAGGMGAVGLDWQVLGFGRFAGNANESDMIMRDSANGNLEFYNIVHNQVVGAGAAGNIGTDWQIAGVGDFSTNPNETDLLMRAGNGDFAILDISHDAGTGRFDIGQVGADWQPVGFGNFTGNANETDMLMRQNSTGALEYYDIRNNAVVAAGPLGSIGSSTQVIGVGVLNPTSS